MILNVLVLVIHLVGLVQVLLWSIVESRAFTIELLSVRLWNNSVTRDSLFLTVQSVNE